MTDEDFNRLTTLYLEDAIESGDLDRLNLELSTSPERVQQFNDIRALAGLIHEHGRSAESSFAETSGKVRSTGIKRRALLAMAVSTFCALLLIGVWSLLSQNGDSDDATEVQMDESIARLKNAVKVEWLGENQPAPGAALNPGMLEFASGMTELEFYSGARVIVEGPARINLLSPYLVHCFEGKIRARVPGEAQGFTIQTPSFELVDLGTEFGLDIASSGKARVRVFDGEVELNSAHQKKQSVLGGQSVTIDNAGVSSLTEDDGAIYPSFDDIQNQADSDARGKQARWAQWNESLRSDPRIVKRFDFENQMLDQGVIVGCHWAEGRWPGKGALEFRHTGDRVRVAIPGKFSQLTLMTWIRLDALPKRRFQALLLTDEHRQDHIHWQLTGDGGLHLGAGLKPGEKNVKPKHKTSVFDQNKLGVWSHVCTTFSQQEGMVRHYLNGKQVSERIFDFGRPLQIGIGDIGNWSVPAKSPKGRSPRNFIGAMDEMTIWNVTLSPDEIYEIYQQHRP